MTRLQDDYLPQIGDGNRPLYIRIADAIERDIDTGALPSGSRLPPMRNLAFDIGVTIGTISRAYNLIADRGLVAGEVGRGTYVLARHNGNHPGDNAQSGLLPPPCRSLDITEGLTAPLNLDTTSAIHVGQDEIIRLQFNAIAESMPHIMVDYVHGVPDSWKEAGAMLLSANGFKPSPDTMAATNGAHAGIMAIIMTVTSPGDRIVFETTTYSSVARSAALAGRRIIETPIDEHGLIPEEFEKLCARQHPRLLYLMPSLHNPTLAHLPARRREQLAEICRRYNVWILEDAVYAPLSDDTDIPIAALCPELTFHVGSLSKTVSSALRAGWVSCPQGYATRIQTAHRMFSGGGSWPMKELASQLILSGETASILRNVKDAIRSRTRMLEEELQGYSITTSPHCPFAWLKLPEPWLSGTFRSALLERGMMVSHEDDFKPARSELTLHAVRIAFSSPRSNNRLKQAFSEIRDLLESGMAGHAAIT